MNPYEFIHVLRFDDLSEEVIAQARRCLLDLIGVAAAGNQTELSRIIRNHAVQQFGAGESPARLLFDGRRVSPAGAALAGGMSIDSVDAHDGFNPAKGHAGAGILPALLVHTDALGVVDGKEFLSCLVLAYEIACRAAVALHSSVADYHTSGAWNALGVAAIGARLLRLDEAQTRQALGIAEYHGPRSQMMRCIDHPTMVKDGSGWGAMAGVSAAYLAADGFTGAPAVTLDADEVSHCWLDLGQRWLILEQYFKPYPVCRWAQPPVEAALTLMREHRLTSADIADIEVFSFHEAIRLATRQPRDTEQAQYSLPFAVGIALSRGQLGFTEITGEALHDPEALRLSTTMTLTESEEHNARFPATRSAHIRLRLRNGEYLQSASTLARGNPEEPLSDAELTTKFHALAGANLSASQCNAIASGMAHIAEWDRHQLASWLELLYQPININ